VLKHDEYDRVGKVMGLWWFQVSDTLPLVLNSSERLGVSIIMYVI